MESKTNYSTLMVKPETKKEIIDMRTGLCPNMTINGFVQELANYYRDRHCRECGADLAMKNAIQCNCKSSERL